MPAVAYTNGTEQKKYRNCRGILQHKQKSCIIVFIIMTIRQ